MKKPIAILCCVLSLVLCSPTNNFRAQTQDVVFVGAGDIARCGPENLAYPQATATLLDSLPGSVFAIGDLAYVDGLETEFTRCFDATWGRHRARLHPVPGVHDLIATVFARQHRIYLEPARRARRKGNGFKPIWPPTPPCAP